ncbi:MAG: hypothetical protein JSV21_04010 [Nitrospirota bacterium]|nr:MAG: hypothetical protein JSV21_04010 [Nitrospirota bacterium]
MKFGEQLIQDGIITKEQLGAALERQVIFGGRLGTNLVELGLLKEHELTGHLSRFLRITAADAAALDNAPQEAIDCIPKELAIKYNLVPFRLDKKRLYVASPDAMKIETMDELRFKTGYDVIPQITSEIRLMYAFEKYYGIKRDLRFISVIDSIKEEEAIKEVFEDVGRKKKEQKPIPKAAEPAPKKEPQKQPEVAKPAAPETIEIDVKPEHKAAKPAQPATPQPKAAPPPAAPVEPLDIKESFINVNDKDDIADIIIKKGAEICKRIAIFVVKGKVLEGWRSNSIKIDDFGTEMDSGSTILQVAESRSFFRGPIVDTPANAPILSLLGGAPQDCIFIPISIRDRVVSILYADNGVSDVLSGNVNYLNGLALLASHSFEILILKKRMRDLNIPG